MKSRTSFFNGAVLRKDITRFLPLWLIYLIGSLLIGIENISDYSAGVGYQAMELAESIAVYGIINAIYAFICGQVLFGDLFNSKLCNALHAMPVRRESWFLTHTIAGLAFSVVPNFILSLCFMPFMDGMWYVSLIWLLGVTLQYIFFFGLAALCAVCSGNRLGMTAIYGIVNFFSFILIWFVTNFYEPYLYGFHLRYDALKLFCPVYAIADRMRELVVFQIHRQPISNTDASNFYYDTITTYTYKGLSSDWWYLAVLALVGAAFLGLGVVLYRKRKLETAGDFLAFQPMKPVFTLIFTLSCGAVSQIFEESDLFLIAGLIIGYFGCQMLMQRTVKVFRKKEFLRCGAIVVLLVGSVLLTIWDPLGITRWVPEPEKVESVILSGSYHFDLEYYEENGDQNVLLVENPKLIEELTEIHKLVLSEPEADKYENSRAIHLTYRMKDGRTIERRYYYSNTGAANEKMQQFRGMPEYILGYKDWDEYVNSIETVYVSYDYNLPITGEEIRGLLEAVKADCASGRMTQMDRLTYAGTISLVFEDSSERSFDYYNDCDHIRNWLKENGYPEYMR